MKAKIGCAMLLCLMGYGAGAAESGNMGESIESDPIDFQPDDVAVTRSMGICYPVPSNDYSGENTLSPILNAWDYFYLYEHQNMGTGPATITVLQQPRHGILRLVTEADRGALFSDTAGPADPNNPGYVYLPEEGYLGKDKATFLIDFGDGHKVKVSYFFQAINGPLGNYGRQELCARTGTKWKISSTLNPNGTSTLTSVEYQSPVVSAADTALTDTAALASTLGLNFTAGASFLGSATVDPSAITLTIADLPNGAVGQTVGTTITLDTNAAGHNWFIDTTPADNSEYLPTSNPYEWVAKEGTAAYGKMDMLSVLLHEYGHALGIEHSADNHDYMATTLTPGVRRMPSADELALMQQLISEAKGEMIATSTPTPTLPLQGGGGLPIPLGAGFGLAFLGRMRKSSYGGTSIDVVGAPTITHYAVAANATFANLATPAGWNTQGSVDINPSTGSGRTASVTLSEVSTSQTRLSQVFMLNEQDRYLSFTLSGTALDDLNGAPDDAFEVALLDANTGANLLGGIGLSHSDAFLNIQGDGTEHTAAGVIRTDNADGSRTYRVDLSGVAKNTAVNLSFDLLGFGQDNSHVTLSDIRVSGLPQLHDDVATLLEDNLLTFDPFAQADAALRPLLAAAIVTGPTHGAVTVNADGTFSYTPDLDYFGTDSFSYRLSDGPQGSGEIYSNLATVSLTVTPVNDAPVVADVALTTAEDTALVIALGLYASDVDSTTLTTQIVTGPAHGVLVANADGTYRYTPDANYFGADSFTYKANDSLLDSNIATVSLNVTSVNDAPTLGNLNLAALEDTALAMNLLAAASDVENDPLTAAIIAGPLHGTVVFNPDGSFTYTADANYNGADSFTYQVNDGHLASDNGDSNIATVTLTIASVNDAPLGMDATVTTLEDTDYVFQLADFGYSDAIDAGSNAGANNPVLSSVEGFSAVTISSLPLAGVLTHNGVDM